MHQHSGIIEILLSSITDTYLMVPVLLVLYFILEYFSHTKQLDLISSLKISGPLGPLAGTLLGIIPECGMSVFVTTLFLSRRVTLGTLVATYLATSDEALPVLIANRGYVSQPLVVCRHFLKQEMTQSFESVSIRGEPKIKVINIHDGE